ncbi:extracellular cell wall glucanase crf1 allergen asp f9 [Colletotrichum truncatum]|uniref:Extracellular cell wall glucanase crf1 allergen asp f9 n=1 Tax=Colletotrichum truncatum TaxID=5467 RepID=A0ACC3YWN7_COLTU|nr:extracellular cell wall glucanase crf1 allergen asp f9 [Colletotrichum truncatum]KAF6787468.1 extracellular cell wall glucanase crf1 allergen asp f9 [Colletotrichum truncatum]
MAMSFVRQASLVALLATSTFAQTFTDCDPTKKTCPANAGMSSSTYSVDFTKGADEKAWKTVAGNVSYTSAGAEFTLNKKGDAPTIETAWYFFFGRAEVHMKAAPGTGIVSSVVLESDDLDEVDWEWLGGKNAEVQTNYFGKGNTTSYDRGAFHTVSDAQGTSHNYTIDWSKEAVVWYIDGTLVRTLNYADALGGQNFPQTPMRLRLGIWAGGDPDNSPGTITWAGGETDYSKAPYTMTVEKVSITNANPAGSYTYGDMTGSWQSIKLGDATTDDSTNSGQNDTSSGTPSSSSRTAAASATASSGFPSASSGPLKNATTTGGTTIRPTVAPTATQSGSAASASASTGANAASGKLMSGSTIGSAVVGGVLVALAGLF